MLEEADDNAALGDPTYVPEIKESVDSTASGDTSRGTLDGDDLVGHEMAKGASEWKEKQLPDLAASESRYNRSSTTSTSTTADFFEARDKRTSTDS